jgi:hypothetical protein
VGGPYAPCRCDARAPVIASPGKARSGSPELGRTGATEAEPEVRQLAGGHRTGSRGGQPLSRSTALPCPLRRPRCPTRADTGPVRMPPTTSPRGTASPSPTTTSAATSASASFHCTVVPGPDPVCDIHGLACAELSGELEDGRVDQLLGQAGSSTSVWTTTRTPTGRIQTDKRDSRPRDARGVAGRERRQSPRRLLGRA